MTTADARWAGAGVANEFHRALMITAAKSYAELVETLLQHGADPNSADQYGWTR